MHERGYIIVTDTIPANTGADVSDALQQLILDNPNRTIYFPDGEYVISKPICTPANPEHSVMLELSNYAVIKASADWSSEEAMIRLGAAEPFNDITTNGSNYGITGGIIDGSGVANGISVDSGRESRIEKVSIKHTFIGIYIKYGANSRSSDADILDVNIVGNSKVGSVGVLIDGCDNTLTNMRIAEVQIGVKILAPSQFLKNIHPLYLYKGELGLENYGDSYGFWDDTNHQCWYNNCYSDQFATGFRMKSGARHIYADCFCYWYTEYGGIQRGYEADGKFNSILRNCHVMCKPKCPDTAFLKVKEAGGHGRVECPITVDKYIADKTYLDYLHGEVIEPV